MNDKKTRGFITIATGDKHYYKLAANFLSSYRMFSKNPFPVSIIAEEENKYTSLFDNVIIATNVQRSFNDKFLLLQLCPYDETIFVDADCLAYGDLNEYWTFFEDATDFSAMGENFDLSDNNGAWYNVSGIGKYAELINYKVRVHAGILFVRKSVAINKLYDDCMALFRDWSLLSFHTCPNSKDECILGIAMPMNCMKARTESAHLLACLPCLTKLKCKIREGKLSCATFLGDSTDDGILVHWGTNQTYKALYTFEVECMENMLSGEKKFIDRLKYDFKFRYYVLKAIDFGNDISNVIYRIAKKLFGK